MSSMKDSYYYENYGREFYEEGDGPPLIRKTSRILLTVVQNDVEGLASLLDSSEWYNTRDQYGYNILQIAILRDNKEVFDYIVSLPDFPLDDVDSSGHTALVMSLTGFISNDIWMSGHYAYKLLQADVKIDFIDLEGNTLLHCALERCFVNVARLLLEKGADVNAQNNEGSTPLHVCASYCENEDLIEGVSMLLCYGADPWICDNNDRTPLELVMYHAHHNILSTAEQLFHYSFDELSNRSLSFECLLQAAHSKLPLFYEMIEKCLVVETMEVKQISFFPLLFSIEPHYLRVLIEKYPQMVEFKFLEEIELWLENRFYMEKLTLVNLDILMHISPIAKDNFCCLNSTSLLRYMLNIGMAESSITELFCYMLSYGMIVNGEDLKIIYEQYKYNELFSILLHMDVGERNEEIVGIIPALYYRIDVHVDSFLQDPFKYITESGIEELLLYSARPRLKELCYQLNENKLIEKVMRLPQVPLLTELARDAFRRYFIEKLNITTSSQFYTMLKLLPISKYYKEIITFQKPLYL